MTEIIRTTKHFIVFERQTVNDLLATSAAAASPHMYGIKRGKHQGRVCWRIPKKQLEYRIARIAAEQLKFIEKMDRLKELLDISRYEHETTKSKK